MVKKYTHWQLILDNKIDPKINKLPNYKMVLTDEKLDSDFKMFMQPQNKMVLVKNHKWFKNKYVAQLFIALFLIGCFIGQTLMNTNKNKKNIQKVVNKIDFPETSQDV